MRPYVIAEAGSSHEMSLQMATDLVRDAAAIGANAVKFQYYSDADAYAKRRGVPDAYRDVYRKYAIPNEWLDVLSQEANRLDIEFGCSTFLPQDVVAVADVVSFFKVASFESEDREHLEQNQLYSSAAYAMGGKIRPVIISLGMGSSPDTAIDVFGGPTDPRLCFLHCVSAYPTVLADLNLARIHQAGLAGFSDHSANEDVGAWAVAAGAVVIEAHLRHYKTPNDNPDFPHSMLPHEFARYIKKIREVELAIGTGESVAQRNELQFMPYRSWLPKVTS